MSSNKEENTENSQTINRWAIVPYIPLRVLLRIEGSDNQRSGQAFDDSTLVEKPALRDVLSPTPISSVRFSGNHESSQVWQQPPPQEVDQVETGRTRRTVTAKVVSTSDISIRIMKFDDHPVKYGIQMIEYFIGPPSNDIFARANYDDQGRRLSLLEGWKMDLRKRPNGIREKFFFHPSSSRMFRSTLEVTNFLRRNYNPQNELQRGDEGFEGLQDSQWVKLPKTFIGLQSSTSSISMSHKAYVEGFLAEARQNLLNSFDASATRDEEETMEKEAVEDFNNRGESSTSTKEAKGKEKLVE